MSDIIPKTISIHGVTGSIGQNTADVILSTPEAFDVEMVSAAKNVKALAKMAVKLNANTAVIADEERLAELRSELDGTNIEALGGRQALIDKAACPVDMTMAAIVGMAGLGPLIAAIKSSKIVAIANKEPLVAAGPQVIEFAQKYETKILPVDSEHNAIFQVFETDNRSAIKRLILTASGGPFREWSRAQMASATLAQAVSHPNWDMGAKISVDSASMMNKALEIIEARYLFDMSAKQIDVLIHPQSLVHSMVEYSDGSILSQMGASDMRTPITYALSWPSRMKTPGNSLDIKAFSKLEFYVPNTEQFPALTKAYDALKAGQGHCIALNAANEIAVNAFMNEKISFLNIMDVIDFVLEGVTDVSPLDIEGILAHDEACRAKAGDYVKGVN